MKPTKIVVIGAGSVIFTLRMLQDLQFHREKLRGSTIVLVDLDERKLEQIARLARQLLSLRPGYAISEELYDCYFEFLKKLSERIGFSQQALIQRFATVRPWHEQP